jgi:hypothetical protein
MFTPLDNPARISPGSAWYFNVLCLLRWIILPGSPQDQLGILMYYVYSAGISPESPRPAGISSGSFILGFMYYVYSAG